MKLLGAELWRLSLLLGLGFLLAELEGRPGPREGGSSSLELEGRVVFELVDSRKLFGVSHI